VTPEDVQYLQAARRRIEGLLASRRADPLRQRDLSPEVQAFAGDFDRLLEQLSALQLLSVSLANGDLSHEAPPRQHLLDPLKQLQGNLRHLTWQAQQIAAGDLDQEVDFLGEFSEAFNRMIEGLREKRRAEERIRYMSQHDALTGLYNRAWFNEQMQTLSGSAFPVSFVMADLDDLKAVNDGDGHAAGDALIQKAAKVLERSVRLDDAVVRLGGDEFAIILQGTDSAGAQVAMARIRNFLRDYNRSQPTPSVSVSLGAGTAGRSQDLHEALHQADTAMYRDKGDRKARSGLRSAGNRRAG